MTKEQFCYWLSGILDSNEELTVQDMEKIREKLEETIATADPVTPYIPPYTLLYNLFEPIGPYKPSGPFGPATYKTAETI